MLQVWEKEEKYNHKKKKMIIYIFTEDYLTENIKHGIQQVKCSLYFFVIPL